MKRILLGLLFTICCIFISPGQAQPSWVKKATKSVFTLKTFSADGSLIGSSNGFFVGPNGEAISNFTPFKGASRAIIIDAAGNERPVKTMMGANDMYDIAKFRVAASKTQPLTLATAIAPTGSMAWLLPYREVKNVLSGPIRQAETFQNEYGYYTIALQTPETAVSCPLFNEAGEVLGLMQQPATAQDSLSYAVSARFADSLKVTGLSLNDPVFQQTKIKMELPLDIQEANLLIYMAASNTDSATYVSLVEDFIQQFPNDADGYTFRAELAAGRGDFASADNDMKQALQRSKEKDGTHYGFARLIYNKNIYQSHIDYADWSLDKALSEAQEANKINPQPIYRQMEANILFAQKKYEEAYQIFNELTKTKLNSADNWFCASRCKEMLKDTTAWFALLDSTMNMFSRPYLKEAAPYLWARANARIDTRKFRDAVSDLNEYEQLMAAQVNGRFYYIRSQAEIEGRLYQQALNDINRALQMEPEETLYYAEKASLQIRVGQYDEALATANECIAVNPENSDGYLFKGLALCLKGNKAEGIPNLQKARELGDPQVDALIEKYK